MRFLILLFDLVKRFNNKNYIIDIKKQIPIILIHSINDKIIPCKHAQKLSSKFNIPLVTLTGTYSQTNYNCSKFKYFLQLLL